jgi:hypothetical protein
MMANGPRWDRDPGGMQVTVVAEVAEFGIGCGNKRMLILIVVNETGVPDLIACDGESLKWKIVLT